MPVGIDEVTVETTTDSKMCAIVSVQNVTVSITTRLRISHHVLLVTLDRSAELYTNVFREDDVDNTRVNESEVM